MHDPDSSSCAKGKYLPNADKSAETSEMLDVGTVKNCE